MGEWGSKRGGWGCWVTEQEAGRQTLSTGCKCWQRWSRRRRGLPDWMGPAMPWWSMGQVLGFSHCREFAFNLLRFSVCLRMLFCPSPWIFYLSIFFFLLTAESVVCVSSAPPLLSLLPVTLLPLLHKHMAECVAAEADIFGSSAFQY